MIERNIPVEGRALSGIDIGDGEVALGEQIATDSGDSGASYTDVFFIGDGGGNVYSINKSDGSIKWETNLFDGIMGSPELRDGKVVIQDDDGDIGALDADDGSIIWTRTDLSGKDASSEKPPLVKDGTVWTSVENTGSGSYLYAFNLSDGSTIWSINQAQYDISGYDLNYYGPNNYIIVSGIDGVKAWDKDGGGRQWFTSFTGDCNEMKPTTFGDHVYHGIGSTTFEFSKLNVSDGTQDWQSTLGDSTVNPESAPALTSDYPNSFFATRYGEIVKGARSDGSVTWTAISNNNDILSSPAYYNDWLYVGDNGNNLYKVAASDGTVDWTHGHYGSVKCSPMVDGSEVFVGDDNGNIYSIAVSDGSGNWSNLLNSGVQRSSPVSGQADWQHVRRPGRYVE